MFLLSSRFKVSDFACFRTGLCVGFWRPKSTVSRYNCGYGSLVRCLVSGFPYCTVVSSCASCSLWDTPSCFSHPSVVRAFHGQHWSCYQESLRRLLLQQSSGISNIGSCLAMRRTRNSQHLAPLSSIPAMDQLLEYVPVSVVNLALPSSRDRLAFGSQGCSES